MPVEQHIFHLVNGGAWTHPALDRAMFLVSAWSVWWPLLAFACVAILVCGSFRARAFVLITAIAVGIADGVIVRPLKKVAGRPRPHESIEGVRGIVHDRTTISRWEAAFVRPLQITVSESPLIIRSGKSFPSAHSANNFAVAGVALVFFRRRAWPFFVFAAAVAYSRLHLGVHWPSDVIAGACIGLVVGMLTTLLVDWLWHRAIAPHFPKLAAAHPNLYRQ